MHPTISLDPRVFGSPFVTWTALTAALLLVLALFLAVYRAPTTGVSRAEAYRGSVYVALLALFCARLVHVLDFAAYYVNVPLQALYIWHGGFSAWGAVIGGCAGLAWYARRHDVGFARLADASILPAFLGIAVFRLIDFLTGQRLGVPTELPWGVVYAHPLSQAYALGSAQHPVALYEMALVLVVLAAYGVSARSGSLRRLPHGVLFLAGLGAYAAIRVVIGFATMDPRHLGMGQAQWMALAVLVGLSVFVGWRRRAGARRATTAMMREVREEDPVA